MEKIKILSYENQCVYNASITVNTQKQTTCVTLNYEAVTSLILHTLCSSFIQKYIFEVGSNSIKVMFILPLLTVIHQIIANVIKRNLYFNVNKVLPSSFELPTTKT